MLNEKEVKKIDELAKDLHMSRSSLCATVICASLPSDNDEEGYEYDSFIDWIETARMNSKSYIAAVKADAAEKESGYVV